MTNFVPSAYPVVTGGGESSSHKITPSFYDSDSADTHTFTVDTTNTLGSVTINDDGTFSYNPAGQFEYLALGEKTTDTFTYTVIDSSGASSSATVTIELFGSNDGPVAFASSETTDEGSAVTITPSYSDADTTDAHSFTVDTTSTLGSVIINADGTFSYDPIGQFEYLSAGETATDSFTYTVTDEAGESSSETVTVTITGQNDAPIAISVNAEVNEGGSTVISSDYSDVDTSDTHIVSIINTNTSGAVITNADGTFSYDTDGKFDHLGAGETATDSFFYVVTDGSWASAGAQVTITITGENDAPVAAEVSSETNEDSSVVIMPSYSDADTSDTHSFSVDTTNTRGSVTVNDDGTFSYHPQGQFDGLTADETATDTFTYTVTDSSGASSTETVTIKISGVNDAPVVDDIAATTSEDESVFIEPAFSDAEVSDTHTVTIDASETTGQVSLVDGSFQYNPNGQFEHLAVGESTTDTFTYTVDDGNGGVVTKTVTITITGTNDAPVASETTASTGEDNSITINPTYSDVDISDTHSFSVDTTNTLGSVAVNDDGTFAYDPNGQFEDLAVGETTSDSFSYSVTDSSGVTSINTVTVTITGQNDAPKASAITASTGEGSSVTIAPSYSDVDTSDTHSFSADTANTIGSVTVNDDGSFSYDPANLVGSLGLGETTTDTFNYTITDSAGESSIATASVTVVGDSEILSGSTDKDTYSIWADSGSTMIDYTTEVDGGGFDTIVFEDLSLADVKISIVEHDGENGTALKISWEADGDRPAGQIQIANMGAHIERYEFADGTNLSKISVFSDGKPRLFGTDEADVFIGSDANEEIYGSDGADVIDGGGGDDTLNYSASTAAINVNMSTAELSGGYAEGDQITNIKSIYGSNFDDVIIGDDNDNGLYASDGIDHLEGKGGDDVLNAFGSGADYLDGGEGQDTVRYRWSSASVVVNLLDQSQNAGDAEGDTYISIENIVGSDLYSDHLTGDDADNSIWSHGGDDKLFGEAGSDHLNGGDGHDTLYGGADNDVLIGEAGDDKLFGGEGDDFLRGGSGSDYLDGGIGTDWISYTEYGDLGQISVIDLLTGTGSGGVAAGDTYVSIENANGSDGDDHIIGTAGDNILGGRKGDDTLVGQAGNDTLHGGKGSDNFVFEGSSFGNDVITDFKAGAESDDIISFDADLFANLEAVLMAATDDGVNTVIVLDEDNSVTLTGVLTSDLHSDDFQFI
ncbi:Ig-like domain-containing protein [Pseudovibrio sp. Ad13]|uniref:Ig-like domain-containing protein n=1 Tax=Pseudovibrio sp. Ad13 TaxID=989396 RepID=UPI00187D5DE5|nr:Ig-like domain-containing protein [Pseudovibrio sp. Ad13]